MSEDNPLYDVDRSRLEVMKLAEDITKARLENEKLTRDLSTYDERFSVEKKKSTLERSRFKWETVRLLGVALITGCLTLLGNWLVKKYELGENNIKAESDRFFKDQKDVLAMQGDPVGQAKSACAVLKEYPDLKTVEVMQKKDTLEHLCNVSSSFAASKEDDKDLSKKLKKSVEPPKPVQQKLDALENRKQNLQNAPDSASHQTKAEIKKIDDSVQNIAKSAGIETLAAASEHIGKTYVNDLRTVNQYSMPAQEQAGRKMAKDYPRTLWFKEGYYLVFEDMKIFLADLNAANGKITVNVCQSTDNKPCPKPLVPDTDIDADSPLKFPTNNADYVIRLDHIGHAGNNPFTKAAYITIEKYDK